MGDAKFSNVSFYGQNSKVRPFVGKLLSSTLLWCCLFFIFFPIYQFWTWHCQEVKGSVSSLGFQFVGEGGVLNRAQHLVYTEAISASILGIFFVLGSTVVTKKAMIR